MNLAASPRGRNLLFAALYFSEGAPIGYLWWALPTKLADAGVSVAQITSLTSILVLPWALKFLWAPLVDGLRSRRWGFRAWITLAQLCMIATFVPLIYLPLTAVTPLLTGLLLTHALFAATQDVAIDAFCIQTVADSERGAINGWMQFGMLLGRSIFGGAILWLEQYVGESVALWGLIAAIGVSLLLLWSAQEPAPRIYESHKINRVSTFLATMRSAFLRPVVLIGILFAVTGGAAFEGLGALIPSLLDSIGVPKETVGAFRFLPVTIAIAIGALTGGYLADRVGHRRMVVTGTIVLCAIVLLIAGLLQAGTESPTAIVALLSLYYLAYGTTIAVTYAMFMNITDPRVGGTQFSAFMGGQNLCEAWSSRAAGAVAQRSGYPAALGLVVAISLIALFLLRWIRPSDAQKTRD